MVSFGLATVCFLVKCQWYASLEFLPLPPVVSYGMALLDTTDDFEFISAVVDAADQHRLHPGSYPMQGKYH